MTHKIQATPQPASGRSYLGRTVRRIVRENSTLDKAGATTLRVFSPLVSRKLKTAGPINPQPFFVVGSGRSGNTLVRRLLVQSPSLHIPPETYVLGTVVRIFERNSHQPWSTVLKLVLSTFEYHPGFESFDISLRPLYQTLRGVASAEQNLATILDGIYRYHAEQSGVDCRRWGDKTPLNSYSLERIHRVFPQAQFIHVLRDGVDVIDSYVSSGLMNSIEEASTRWITSVKAVRRFEAKHPSLVLEMRYEDLVTDPTETVSRLYEFLDESDAVPSLDFDGVGLGDVERYPHHASTLQAVDASRIGRGRQKLKEADMKSLDPDFSKVLVESGYPNI